MRRERAERVGSEQTPGEQRKSTGEKEQQASHRYEWKEGAFHTRRRRRRDGDVGACSDLKGSDLGLLFMASLAVWKMLLRKESGSCRLLLIPLTHFACSTDHDECGDHEKKSESERQEGGKGEERQGRRGGGEGRRKEGRQ